MTEYKFEPGQQVAYLYGTRLSKTVVTKVLKHYVEIESSKGTQYGFDGYARGRHEGMLRSRIEPWTPRYEELFKQGQLDDEFRAALRLESVKRIPPQKIQKMLDTLRAARKGIKE